MAEHLCSRFSGFIQPVLLSCAVEGGQEAWGGKGSHHRSPILPILGCASQNGGSPLFYRAEGALCVHQDGAGQRDVRDGVRKGMHSGERSVRRVSKSGVLLGGAARGGRQHAGVGMAAAKVQLVCPVLGRCTNLRFLFGGRWVVPPQKGPPSLRGRCSTTRCVRSGDKAAQTGLKQPPSRSGAVPMPAERGQQKP